MEKINYYPEKILRSFQIATALEKFSSLKKSKKKISLAGRVIAKRELGSINFFKIRDQSGEIQIIFKKDLTKNFHLGAKIELGDFISATGFVGFSKTKEKSLFALKWQWGAKVIKPIPKEYYKIKDIETLIQKPYLRTLLYPENLQLFEDRYFIIKTLREILWQEGFIEVETPILQTHYGGASAKPFVTYLEALNLPLYLRIAPELYLKKMIVGGFEKIFEIGKNFRNEGIDREHNPEFTMMELYWAYQDREGLMNFTKKILQKLVKIFNRRKKAKGLKIKFQNKTINFGGEWKKLDYCQMVKSATNLDFFENSLDDFKKFAKENGIEIKAKFISKGKIVDEIYKKLVRPNIIQPTFLINHPKEISPLAKLHPEDPRLTLRFQLLVAGTELVNAFAELNDPIDQKERFEEEAQLLKKGEEEAHPYDETFIEALEYGMPPTAGLGIGIDRLVMILTNKRSIKEIIYFPFAKPSSD